MHLYLTDFELDHFTCFAVGRNDSISILSHGFKRHCKIPPVGLSFSPSPQEEHTPER